MAIPFEQAKNLAIGELLHHLILKDAKGDPVVVRVSGKPKTWKTRPGEVSIPVKYGLYKSLRLDEDSLSNWVRGKDDPISRFRELEIGDRFDFVDPNRPALNSFYKQCTKISPRKYQDTDGEVHKIGSINARVFPIR